MSETKIPVTRICDDCGLTTRWFYMVKSGEIADPGYQRLQRLYDYLHQDAAA